MRLYNKVAIVTGASKGIGKAIAIKLAELGADVVINYKDSEMDGLKVAKKIISLGRKTLTIQVDISNRYEVSQMIDRCIEEFGKVDILINNAGITRDKTMVKMSFEEWDEVIKVNLYGAYNCIKSVTPYMRQQKYGRIVNISSIIGLMGNFGQSNYAASKAALIGLSKSLANELARYNILVNAVAPGFVDTDMVKHIPSEILDKVIDKIPLKRLARPDEIADVVAFLVCNDYVTGEVIVVDGGLSLGL